MPKQYRIIIQPKAVEGLENSYQWILAESPEYAHQWINGLMEIISTLETLPARCPLAPENDYFEEEIRQLLYGKRNGVYRILFTINGDNVNILYIRHGAQHWIDRDSDNKIKS